MVKKSPFIIENYFQLLYSHFKLIKKYYGFL